MWVVSVWVWGGDTGCGALEMKVLLFCGLVDMWIYGITKDLWFASIGAAVLVVVFTVSHRTFITRTGEH